jgi:uncharacterized protein with HEPN domain
MQERLRISLELMLDAITAIQQHLWWASADIMLSNPTILDACLMQLLHIGELAWRIHKRYPDFTLPHIEMTRIIGLRNLIAHDYLWVNKRVVVRIIQANLPELKTSLELVLW